MATIARPLISLLSRSIAANRSIATTVTLYKTIDDLEKAKVKVTQLKEDPGNAKKLELYSLYKQVRHNASCSHINQDSGLECVW